MTELNVGQSVWTRADGVEDPVTATVSFIASHPEFTPPVIYSAASRDKLVFLIEAKVPAQSALKPGLPVTVDWT